MSNENDELVGLDKIRAENEASEDQFMDSLEEVKNEDSSQNREHAATYSDDEFAELLKRYTSGMSKPSVSDDGKSSGVSDEETRVSDETSQNIEEPDDPFADSDIDFDDTPLVDDESDGVTYVGTPAPSAPPVQPQPVQPPSDVHVEPQEESGTEAEDQINHSVTSTSNVEESHNEPEDSDEDDDDDEDDFDSGAYDAFDDVDFDIDDADLEYDDEDDLELDDSVPDELIQESLQREAEKEAKQLAEFERQQAEAATQEQTDEMHFDRGSSVTRMDEHLNQHARQVRYPVRNPEQMSADDVYINQDRPAINDKFEPPQRLEKLAYKDSDVVVRMPKGLVDAIRAIVVEVLASSTHSLDGKQLRLVKSRLGSDVYNKLTDRQRVEAWVTVIGSDFSPKRLLVGFLAAQANLDIDGLDATTQLIVDALKNNDPVLRELKTNTDRVDAVCFWVQSSVDIC